MSEGKYWYCLTHHAVAARDGAPSSASSGDQDRIDRFRHDFWEALASDLNAPQAIAETVDGPADGHCIGIEPGVGEIAVAGRHEPFADDDVAQLPLGIHDAANSLSPVVVTSWLGARPCLRCPA